MRSAKYPERDRNGIKSLIHELYTQHNKDDSAQDLLLFSQIKFCGGMPSLPIDCGFLDGEKNIHHGNRTLVPGWE